MLDSSNGISSEATALPYPTLVLMLTIQGDTLEEIHKYILPYDHTCHPLPNNPPYFYQIQTNEWRDIFYRLARYNTEEGAFVKPLAVHLFLAGVTWKEHLSQTICLIS